MSNVSAAEVDEKDDMREDGLISEPVPYNEICADIPKKEDVVFQAIRFNDLHTVERQLREGLDINAKHREEPGDTVYVIKDLSRMVRQLRLMQYSLLHVAAIHGKIETIELLLSHGACVNVTDQNHMSPLSLATAVQRADVVKLLIEKGADVNVQSVSGRTPLIQAIENNNLTIVQLLIDAKADLNLTDYKGTTPLFSCVTARKDIDLNIMRALIKGGCQVDLTNKQGATPLMMAVGLSRINVVEVLLEAGANINVVDKTGKTVVHMATGINTALFLINNGAASDCPDKQGTRPIDRAAHNGHIPLICLFLCSDCHRTTDIMNIPRVIQSRESVPHFDLWLHQELYNPRELKRLCRQIIRQCLGIANTTHVNELPVPKLLKDFLLAKNLDLPFNLSVRNVQELSVAEKCGLNFPSMPA